MPGCHLILIEHFQSKSLTSKDRQVRALSRLNCFVFLSNSNVLLMGTA